ncbi:multiple epidermal growth factor-like domains protein 10, partial [Saccostrea echinata]|uniref:multiple epidermal growth factor-like domains protein 10 n=1 Tax=Saccostrea echinata TaxID=191078 RepID=UPI002A7FC918
CPLGQYGADCEEYCGECGGECHHEDGACLEGCENGYRGLTCKTECKPGTYGLNCTGQCGECIGHCNHSAPWEGMVSIVVDYVENVLGNVTMLMVVLADVRQDTKGSNVKMVGDR